MFEVGVAGVTDAVARCMKPLMHLRDITPAPVVDYWFTFITEMEPLLIIRTCFWIGDGYQCSHYHREWDFRLFLEVFESFIFYLRTIITCKATPPAGRIASTIHKINVK